MYCRGDSRSAEAALVRRQRWKRRRNSGDVAEKSAANASELLAWI